MGKVIPSPLWWSPRDDVLSGDACLEKAPGLMDEYDTSTVGIDNTALGYWDTVPERVIDQGQLGWAANNIEGIQTEGDK